MTFIHFRPIVGALCDRYGCRIVVVVGAVLSCAGFLVSSFATSVFYLCLSYGTLAGLGFGLMYIPAGVCVIQHFNKRRALANGIAVCGSGVGTFVFNQLTRYLIDHYGWRGTLMLEAGITLQGAVLGLFLLPPSHRKKAAECDEPLCRDIIVEYTKYDVDLERSTKSSNEEAKSEVNGEPNLLERTTMEMDVEDYKPTEDTEEVKTIQRTKSAGKIRNMIDTVFNVELLKDFRCWLFLMSAFMLQLAFTIPFNLIPDQAIENGMTKHQGAWLISSIGISNTVSRVCFGWFGDLKGVNRQVILEAILVLAGLSTGLSIFLTTFELKMIYTCLYGFLVGGYVTLCTVVLADLFGAHIIAKSFGLLMFSIGVSGFISTPIGGLLFDMTGKYDATFVVAGAEFIVAWILLFLLKICSNKRMKT